MVSPILQDEQSTSINSIDISNPTSCNSSPTPSPTKPNLTVQNNPFGHAVGEMKSSFKGCYNGEKGSLYVATMAICFRQTGFFGGEVRREVIPWRSIHNIYTNGEGGVSFQTISGKVYDFIDLETNVDFSLQLCRNIWSSCRRMAKNQSSRSGGNGSGTHGNDEQHAIKLIRRTFSSDHSVLSDGDEAKRESDASENIIYFLFNAITSSCLTSDEDEGAYDSESDEVVEETQEEKESEVEDSELSVPDDHDREAFEMWKECVESKEPSFRMKPIMNLQLNCNFQQFHDQFVKDNAPYSIVSYHRIECGDHDVTCTPWNYIKDSNSYTRTITYVHPVNNPMAPPTSFTTKKQEMKIYGTYGICIDTRTDVAGIPMADSFYIEDRLLVENRMGGMVSIHLFFDVRFERSILLKKIIEKSASVEVDEFHTKFGDYLQNKSSGMIDGGRCSRGPSDTELKIMSTIMQEPSRDCIANDISKGDESKHIVVNGEKSLHNDSGTFDEEFSKMETSSSTNPSSSSAMTILVVLLLLVQVHVSFQLQHSKERISFLEDLVSEGRIVSNSCMGA